MTNDASKFVGSIPEYYDACLGPRIFEGFAADLAGRVARTGARSVLELAAGTGIMTRKLRDGLSPSSELVATDLNGPMLDSARPKFADKESVRFQEANAMELPFPDASFDCIACQFGVMFFPDKARSYAEAYRVLKANGRYLFNVWDSWSRNEFARVAHEVVTGFFPESPPGFYKVPFGYQDTEAIAAALADAGFAAVEHEIVQLVADIPSAEDFATGLIFGNPLFDEIRERQGNPEAIRDSLAVAINERLGNAMTLQAIVFSAAR
jgi:ubiquinone/menaquinone biosynthesis C-methylase UbiE